MSRSGTEAYVAANSATSAALGVVARSLRSNASRLSSSAIPPSPRAVLPPARRKAPTYCSRLPPKRRCTITRSAARASPGPIEVACCCTSLAKRIVKAASASRVTRASCSDLVRRDRGGAEQRNGLLTPRSICPAARSRSNRCGSALDPAQRRVARPEPDAAGAELVRVACLLVEEAPAPGDDVAEPELARDVLRRQGLQLRDLEPGAGGLEPLTAARAAPRLERQHDAELGGRHPDRDELGQRVAHGRAHPPAAELGSGACGSTAR